MEYYFVPKEMVLEELKDVILKQVKPEITGIEVKDVKWVAGGIQIWYVHNKNKK